MNRQEEIREGVAYELSKLRINPRPYATTDAILIYLKSQGMVLKKEWRWPSLENKKGEWKTGPEYKRDVEKMRFWEELI